MSSNRIRSHFVVVLSELGNQVVEMIASERDEMIKAFRLDHLNESFDAGIEIR